MGATICCRLELNHHLTFPRVEILCDPSLNVVGTAPSSAMQLFSPSTRRPLAPVVALLLLALALILPTAQAACTPRTCTCPTACNVVPLLGNPCTLVIGEGVS